MRRKEAPSPSAEASTREALAESYAAAGSYDEALNHLRKARQIWSSLNDPRRSLKAGLSLGEVEYRAGRYAYAVEVFCVVAQEFTKLEAPASPDREIDALYDQFFSIQEGSFRHMAKWFRAYDANGGYDFGEEEDDEDEDYEEEGSVDRKLPDRGLRPDAAAECQRPAVCPETAQSLERPGSDPWQPRRHPDQRRPGGSSSPVSTNRSPSTRRVRRRARSP